MKTIGALMTFEFKKIVYTHENVYAMRQYAFEHVERLI